MIRNESRKKVIRIVFQIQSGQVFRVIAKETKECKAYDVKGDTHQDVNAHLAAQCDGGPASSLSVDSRRHYGERRPLFAGTV